MEGDFSFLHWAEHDLFCLAGYKRFYLVNGDSGRVVASRELEFTDKEPLDLLQLLIGSSRDKFIVLSTKIGWLIDQGKGSIRKVAIPGLAESLAQERDGFKIGYVDTTNIALPKCFMVVE
ncbi:MAG: hypothetical protein WCL11_19175 [Verrucomicrobiota bacterium]